MAPFCEKIYLQLNPPTEDLPLGDRERILLALETLGYSPVAVPLTVLQQVYPLCRNCGFDITVTLVWQGQGWQMAAVEAGDTRHWNYGLAVDYGSTTIVMQLVDLNSGSIIGQAKAFNGQSVYGSDILTRITYVMEDPAHADDVQRATAETFDQLLLLLEEETGIEAGKCPVMIVSGNTTMVHFLLKLDAWTVFASPYAPVTADPGWFRGAELGMNFGGIVYLIPAASNYVGGDIVSGLLTLDLHKNGQPSLFFDIGTNGELVIGCKDWIMGGAGAAGPALEGYISRYGMRAATGAVDTVKISGSELTVTTIQNGSPVGICGSGIIDLLAQMRLHGWINIAGELDQEKSPRIIYLEDEKQHAVVYAQRADGAPLFFTQTDIRQYLETKAAAFTMIDCLLQTAGGTEQDLDHCWLSGAFTAHSDLEAAITIGIFPDLPREKYTAISNTSLDGARTLLLDREKLADAKYLSENMYCVQFASIPDFLIRMQAAKFIPHTDMERFPIIKQKLKQ